MKWILKLNLLLRVENLFLIIVTMDPKSEPSSPCQHFIDTDADNDVDSAAAPPVRESVALGISVDEPMAACGGDPSGETSALPFPVPARFNVVRRPSGADIHFGSVPAASGLRPGSTALRYARDRPTQRLWLARLAPIVVWRFLSSWDAFTRDPLLTSLLIFAMLTINCCLA